jgi:hypothetical protein
MLLQSFVPYAKSVVIPVQNFDHVTAPVAKNEQIPGKGVLTYDLFDHNGKTVDGFSHVGAAHCQKNPVGLCWKHHIAATSRIRDRDVREALASSSIVNPFGVIIRTTFAL